MANELFAILIQREYLIRHFIDQARFFLFFIYSTEQKWQLVLHILRVVHLNNLIFSTFGRRYLLFNPVYAPLDRALQSFICCNV